MRSDVEGYIELIGDTGFPFRRDDVKGAAVFNLGRILDLESGERVLLKSGWHIIDKAGCFLAAIACEYMVGDAYVELARCTRSKVRWKKVLYQHTWLAEKDCYREALNHNAELDFSMYHRLGCLLGAGEVLTLKNGLSLDRRQCFLESIARNPCCDEAYCDLGMELMDHETVLTLGGSSTSSSRVLTKKDCFVTAIGWWLHCMTVGRLIAKSACALRFRMTPRSASSVPCSTLN